MKIFFRSFVEQFVSETQKLKAGNPLEDDTDISAMITRGDVQRTKDWVDEAINNGADLRLGGSYQEGIFQPTVLADVPSSEKVSCEEVFAPVVHINLSGILTKLLSLLMIQNTVYKLEYLPMIFIKPLRQPRSLRLAVS